VIISEENVESVFRGNTLRVYWVLLQSPNGAVGVREPQREQVFKSSLGFVPFGKVNRVRPDRLDK
jgi:hypothetical protein